MRQTASMELKESEYTYDQKFKQLFGNIKFLASILKNIIKEYKELSLPEIEALVISVQDGEEVVTNLGVEDVGKGDESKTFYDVVAGCRLISRQQFLRLCVRRSAGCAARRLRRIRNSSLLKPRFFRISF